MLGVTSLPKKDSSRLGYDLKRQVAAPCWKLLRCTKVFCPAYNRWDIPCWRVPDTCCNENGEHHDIHTWECCLVCPVFEVYAEADPRGWNHFVCDEFKGSMKKDLTGLAFRRTESLLQILDNLPDGLCIMDKEGRIKYFNATAEQITGLSASDAIGMHCKDIFMTTTCETHSTLKKGNQIGKNLYNKEFIVTRLDGRTVSIISSISVLKDHHGNVIGGVQVFKDISDRKRLEDDLRLSASKAPKT
jgi:PAS domain S-box-containing protein